ncbi:MAG: hypothetical protein HKN32_09000 [Flavobacteriales bacterium]|nr:hypothetical protein [Flavobacteriales bacterium]
MKEDINPPKAKGVAMAIVPDEKEDGTSGWLVYFINLRVENLEGVLVRSNGYGTKDGKQVKTSELRHFLDEVPGFAAAPVETIVEDVFSLNNQYWVSYWEGGQMYDRKFVFVADVIQESNFSKIPILNKQGVMIK